MHNSNWCLRSSQHSISNSIQLILKPQLLSVADFITNPRRMREGYSSSVFCVSCHYTSYIAATYLGPHLYVESKVPLGFLWQYLPMHWMDFIENILFKKVWRHLLTISAFFTS